MGAEEAVAQLEDIACLRSCVGAMFAGTALKGLATVPIPSKLRVQTHLPGIPQTLTTSHSKSILILDRILVLCSQNIVSQKTTPKTNYPRNTAT